MNIHALKFIYKKVKVDTQREGLTLNSFVKKMSQHFYQIVMTHKRANVNMSGMVNIDERSTAVDDTRKSSFGECTTCTPEIEKKVFSFIRSNIC